MYSSSPGPPPRPACGTWLVNQADHVIELTIAIDCNRLGGREHACRRDMSCIQEIGMCGEDENACGEDEKDDVKSKCDDMGFKNATKLTRPGPGGKS